MKCAAILIVFSRHTTSRTIEPTSGRNGLILQPPDTAATVHFASGPCRSGIALACRPERATDRHERCAGNVERVAHVHFGEWVLRSTWSTALGGRNGNVGFDGECVSHDWNLLRFGRERQVATCEIAIPSALVARDASNTAISWCVMRTNQRHSGFDHNYLQQLYSGRKQENSRWTSMHGPRLQQR